MRLENGNGGHDNKVKSIIVELKIWKDKIRKVEKAITSGEEIVERQ